MKKILFVFTLFIGAITAHAQTVEKDSVSVAVEGEENFDANKAIFKFEEEVIDYGKIAKGSDGNRVFKFTNVGDVPLVINNAKGSCGCTVPTYDKEPIMPGETGEIRVKYATSRVGRFSKTVTLTSNASEPRKVIRIKGEVLKP